MITQDTIKTLTVRHQTSELNIIREYFQHLFLSQFYALEGAENILFKGGTALRIIYGSPRFSEDLDFSIFNIEQHQQKKFIEDLFTKVLSEIEKIGIKVEIGPKPGTTVEGYYGDATFKLYDYQVVGVEINISSRNGRKVSGEVDSVANDFVPTYNLYHLPQTELIEEKIFDALLKRKKARDFYDLYFIMRKGLLELGQKKRLANERNIIESEATKVDFKSELSALLPKDQQDITKDFKQTLINELRRQLNGF